jgi:hypothetical protein
MGQALSEQISFENRSRPGKRIGINVFISETIRFKVLGLIKLRIASDNIQAAQQSAT